MSTNNKEYATDFGALYCRVSLELKMLLLCILLSYGLHFLFNDELHLFKGWRYLSHPPDRQLLAMDKNSRMTPDL
jgi:hypothetical protein